MNDEYKWVPCIDTKISDEAVVPEYKTPGAGAMDLSIIIHDTVIVRPGEVVTFGTGIKLNMSTHPDLQAIIIPRSSTANLGLVLANTIGLVDNDYQGEIKLKLRNITNEPVEMNNSLARIAQLLFIKSEYVTLNLVTQFYCESERGEDGFGSTNE